MGRRKIEIRPIQHERNRTVTFLKRKTGLFKKAYELSVLCSINIAIVIFEDRPNSNPKCYEFSSSNVKDVVDRYVRWDGETDTKGADDFASAAYTGPQDDDDEDDNEDPYGRKRGSSMGSYPGQGMGMRMNPDYPIAQPMSVHPSLPGYPQHGAAKRPRNDYHPYADTGYRRPPYSGYYSGSPGPPSNPYPSATAPPHSHPAGGSQYDYATRPGRSSSTSALPGPGPGGDFRAMPAPGSTPSPYGSIVSQENPSSRPGTTAPYPGIDWSTSSDTHSHPPSSTGQSPAMANAHLGSTNPNNSNSNDATHGSSSNDGWMGGGNGTIFDGNRRPDLYGTGGGGRGAEMARPPSAAGLHSRQHSPGPDRGVTAE
ncbi:hypothetical protein DL96DRAFT_722935 [Flagelloscypha sp. PMI_526]|nr:hypothetical protein DL96DRAFT_722935 [Flagelloscypha sp. PMI_526]